MMCEIIVRTMVKYLSILVNSMYYIIYLISVPILFAMFDKVDIIHTMDD